MNITILYENNKIVFINSIGLEFFSVSSVKEFNSTYVDISQLFLPDENCIDKHTYGKKWFDIIKNNNSNYIRVKLFSKRDKMNYYFNINISKLKNNNYLLSFNDITKLESERLIIKKEAEYDPLTEVYNRVKFNKVLQDMIYKANRYDFKFSIILLDIDHFKSINDTYGHNIGDKVLIELSRLINMCLRDNDILARWGGEEFVILSESTSIKEASKFALRLKNIVNEYSFTEVGKVTGSFGVTEFKIGDTQSLLFERVDKALYEAKHNGRNQVVTK
jgi:diguanylate cyclase (GGDEF)-like protein